MFCTKCGQENQDGAKFCTGCGANFNITTPAPNSTIKPESATTPSTKNTSTEVAPEIVSPKITSGVVAPEVVAPEAAAPEVVAPDVVKPEIVAPEVVAPKAIVPEAVTPEVATPEAIPPQASIYSRPSPLSGEPKGNNKKTFLFIIIAAIIVVLLAGGAWLYKRQQAKTASADQTISSISETTEPAPAATVVVTPPLSPPAEPTTMTPVTPGTVESMTASTTAAPITPTATQHQSVTLSKTETNDLVARLQRGTLPANCKLAEAKVRKENHVSVRQAKAIAKRAYPELCGTKSTRVTPSKSMPVESAPVKSESKTATQTYKQRSKAECDSGIAGFICRETLRVQICDGKWSSNPPSGQSVCFRQDN